MANLAIKGHATRGKEVIEILEMLGGVNELQLDGFADALYIISDRKIRINIFNLACCFEHFTLEEFLEKFPYKVGDKVKVKETGKDVIIDGMSWRNGCEVIYDTCYNNDCVSFYSAEELQPYKEETMEEIIKIDIPKGYEFAGVDDDNQQVVFTNIQPEYPKTYEECCDALNIDVSRTIEHSEDCPFYKDITCYEYDLLSRLAYLRKLFVCREAYWKIAGEQMGLGKPWEPDWVNAIYTCTIICRSNKIVKDAGFDADNRILAFPTEEMRDAFYENFKDLIDNCKELL